MICQWPTTPLTISVEDALSSKYICMCVDMHVCRNMITGCFLDILYTKDANTFNIL